MAALPTLHTNLHRRPTASTGTVGPQAPGIGQAPDMIGALERPVDVEGLRETVPGPEVAFTSLAPTALRALGLG